MHDQPRAQQLRLDAISRLIVAFIEEAPLSRLIALQEYLASSIKAKQNIDSTT